MAEWCLFAVNDVRYDPAIGGEVAFRRGCGNDGLRSFGGLPVCWRHEPLLRSAVDSEVANPHFRSDLKALIEEHDEAYRAKRKTELRQFLTGKPGQVYYVHRAGFVKIGFSTNVAQRMKQLARGGDKRPAEVGLGPVELLGSHRGTKEAEAQMHARFAADRIEGEWFRLSDDLREHIAQVNAKQRSRSESALQAA